MADERRVVISSEPHLGPEEVGRRTFAHVFRGYDPTEVRNYLRRVSDELGVARERQRHLEHLLADAQKVVAAPPPPLDEASLTTALGEETARVLRTAREAAADLKAKAEENVQRVLQQAHEDAARIREESEGIHDVKMAEAMQAAEAIRSDARADAEAAAARASAESEALIEAARDQARQMLEEAKEIRAKVLGDVVRRRNVARVQVAQLRAGRERLLDAYRMVRETLDEVTVELGRAEDEARLAAERAGQKASAELAPETDAEIAALDPELLGEPVSVDLAEAEPEPALAVEAIEPGTATATATAEAQAEPDPGERTGNGTSPEPESQPESAAAEPEPEAATEAENTPAGDQLPEAPLDIVEPPSDIEAVRIIVPAVEEASAKEDAADAEASAAEPEPESEPAPDPAEADDEAAPVDELFARIRAGRAEAVARAQQVLAETTHADAAPANGSAPTATQEDPAGALLRARDDDLAPLEAQLAKRLKRAMQDEQNDVLDRLRVHKGRPSLGDVLPDAAAQGARYRDLAQSLLEDAARAGAMTTGTSSVPAGLGLLVAELAEAVTGPLRTRLDDAFAAAAREEDDVNATTERVGAAYREWKMQRIERLAGDHLAAAHALGAFAAAGEGALLRWVVCDLDGPCPDCDDNALAGPTPRGTAFPTGQLHPPAHAGCRCLLVPDSA